MRKIKINGSITQSKFAIIIFVVAISTLLLVSLYLLFSEHSDIDEKIDAGLAIFGIFALFIPVLYSYTKEEEVSDLLIGNNSLTLTYRYKNQVRQKIINKSDIKKFKATYAEFKTNITIELNNDDEDIYFESYSNNPLSTCPYQLLLDLIKIKADLPNFSYIIIDKNPLPQKDIKHFELYGKRLPLFTRYKIAFSKVPVIITIIFIILLVVMIYLCIQLVINYPN